MTLIEAYLAGLLGSVLVLTCSDCGKFSLLFIGSFPIEFKDHDLGENNDGDTVIILEKSSFGDYGATIRFDGFSIRIGVESITTDTGFFDWGYFLGGKDLATDLARDLKISDVCGLDPVQLTTCDLDLILRIEYTGLEFGFSREFLVFTER